VENSCAAPYQAVSDYYITNALTANYSYAKHIELLNIWNQCIAEAQKECLLLSAAAAVPEPPSKYTEIVIIITLASIIVLCILGCCLYSMCNPKRAPPQKPAINHSEVPVVVLIN